jgi:type IV secretory pathway VirD2 relaxase
VSGIIENALEIALTGPVKRKANKTKNLRATAKRVIEGYSEVMVKITGFCKGAGHVKSHINYITRNGNVEMENDRGEIFSGKKEVESYFSDWANDIGDSKRNKNQRDTVRMVLSMPEGTDPESVRQAVREFAKSNFAKNHEYVFVLHTDELHPHCHLTIKSLGFDGKRLNPRKDDLQYWREEFAEKMRDQGVNAEATSRRSRGVVRKAESSIVRHIEKGDEKRAPRVSKVKASKVKQVAEEIAAESRGLMASPKPWDEPIKVRQDKIRSAWLSLANELDKEPTQITFNSKEVKNDRPEYDLFGDNRARQAHRAAALYQSDLEKLGRTSPPGTIASLRNVSSISVVHNKSRTQVLLQQDASNRLERDSGANPKMRREGVGFNRTGAASELMDAAGGEGAKKAVAERIRRFVGGMPAIETEWQQMKRDLIQKFALKAEKSAALSPDGVQQDGASEIKTNKKGKDIER